LPASRPRRLAPLRLALAAGRAVRHGMGALHWCWWFLNIFELEVNLGLFGSWYYGGYFILILTFGFLILT
jgi:hypothetical protein